MNLKRVLRLLALAVAMVAASGWLTLGASRGWTKTSVPIPQKDPVTEMDYIIWEKRFVPGVDLLALGLSGALVLFLVSVFLSNPKTHQSRSVS